MKHLHLKGYKKRKKELDERPYGMLLLGLLGGAIVIFMILIMFGVIGGGYNKY